MLVNHSDPSSTEFLGFFQLQNGKHLLTPATKWLTFSPHFHQERGAGLFGTSPRVRGDLEVDNRWWTCLFSARHHEALGGSNMARKKKGVWLKNRFPPMIFKLFYMAISLESRKRFHWWFGPPSFFHWRINKTFHDYIEKPKRKNTKTSCLSNLKHLKQYTEHHWSPCVFFLVGSECKSRVGTNRSGGSLADQLHGGFKAVGCVTQLTNPITTEPVGVVGCWGMERFEG